MNRTLMLDSSNPAHPEHSNYLISTNGLKAEQVFHDDIFLPIDTIAILLDHLHGHYMERCGFIDNKYNTYQINNVHKNPHSNFYMDTDQAESCINMIYEGLGHNIIGIWHTHPNGYPWPSPRDIAGWPNPKLGWRYFLVTRGRVTEWTLVKDDQS